MTRKRTCKCRAPGHVPLLATLLLLVAVTPAIAQETCGSDPATAPNHSANYILGSAGGVVAAMHWTTGLVWKRCAEGQSWDGSTCTGTATSNQWNDWMADYMPKPFAGSSTWGVDSTGVPNRLLTGAWRLPYKNALLGLTTGCQNGPAINRNAFPNTYGTSSFWSGSPYAASSYSAWYVYFYDGDAVGLLRYDGNRVRLVRGGQSFAPLASPPTQVVPSNSAVTFAPITLQASHDASGYHAWGGARIAGPGNPMFEVNGSGDWVTEAIVTSGDTIRVRLTSGAPGPSRTATLVLRSADTEGTVDDASNAGSETATLQETTAEFTVAVLPIYTTVMANESDSHGTITPESQSVLQGGTAAFTVTPATGYHVASVTGDTCTPIGATASLWVATHIMADCTVTASFALDQPALVLGIDDARDYVRYGQLLTYQVSLSNQGTASADTTISMNLAPGLDAANTHWRCVGAGAGAGCTAQGQGALNDSNVTLPAGTSLHWLVTTSVRMDASSAVVHTTVNASAGSSSASADDLTTLVILRTGFDVIGGDGAERLAMPAARATACPDTRALDGSFVRTFTLQAGGARLFDTALRLVGSGDRALSVQRANVGATTLLRLVSMDAHGQARASHWARVEPGATLALGVAVGTDGQRVALLEGAGVSLDLPLPPGMHKARLYTPPGTARVCER